MSRVEAYRTIEGQAEARYEIQRSKFITHIAHVETEDAARNFVQQVKKQYFDARHNCSAWVLGEKGNQQKSNDDGEPGGTAGNPILEAIKKNELTNVVIVVTRYFGGIKLGAGGLVRAYGHSAVLGIEAADIVHMVPLQRVKLTVDYGQLASAEHWVRQKNLRTGASEYTDRAALQMLCPPEQVEALLTELRDLTAGKCEIELQGESLVAVHEKEQDEKA